MTELIRARCKQGHLIITESHIIIQLNGLGTTLREQRLSRSSLTSIDTKMAVPSVFGLGGGTNLAFHGQGGEVLRAELVPPKKAQEIVRVLDR